MERVRGALRAAFRAAAIGVALPFVVAAPAYWLLVRELRAGRVARAIAFMLAWALLLAIFSTALSYWRPELASGWFINAEPYWREMSVWLETGRGREGDPAQFIPQHLLHLTLFAVLSLVSGSALSLPMGAALMNYMGFYVGNVAAHSSTPLTAALLAWHPWAVLRIVSFIILGVLLAQPLLSRVWKCPMRWREQRPLFIAAGIGLVLDVILKWLLAEFWRQLLLFSRSPYLVPNG